MPGMHVPQGALDDFRTPPALAGPKHANVRLQFLISMILSERTIATLSIACRWI